MKRKMINRYRHKSLSKLRQEVPKVFTLPGEVYDAINHLLNYATESLDGEYHDECDCEDFGGCGQGEEVMFIEGVQLLRAKETE